MMNHEKYKEAYSVIEPSADFTSKVLKEAEKMKQTNDEKTYVKAQRRLRSLATAAAAFTLMISLAVVSYASNLCGFRKMMNVWLYGRATHVQVEKAPDGDGYQITYPDGSVRMAGGITLDDNGNQVEMTADDIIAEINENTDIEADQNGTLWLYYHDHKINLSEKLDENHIARIKVKDGLLPTYFTILWEGDNGYTVETGHTGFPEIKK